MRQDGAASGLPALCPNTAGRNDFEIFAAGSQTEEFAAAFSPAIARAKDIDPLFPWDDGIRLLPKR
jgi:hypothetical protein